MTIQHALLIQTQARELGKLQPTVIARPQAVAISTDDWAGENCHAAARNDRSEQADEKSGLWRKNSVVQDVMKIT